jgi:glycosyltransferase involved in cell wall biosynthesis
MTDQPATGDQTPAPRRRVLVIAEAANPEWVSVPLVGWSIATALRAHHDVHIVTQIRNREAFLRTGLIEGQDFTAIDSEAVARPIWKLAEVLRMGKGKGWTMVTALSSALAYPYFERKLWEAVGARIEAGEFDIVHRVTPLTPTANSRIAARCAKAKVPFVMGPLNGGVPWPKGFDAERRREREWLSYVRGLYRLSPSRSRMIRAASVIIAGSRHTASEFAEARDRLTLIPENGIDPARFSLRAAQPGTLPLRCAFVGRLVPYKGPDMLIEAAEPFLRDGTMVLDILGDGPLMPALKDMVAAKGLTKAVTLHGWIDHKEVQSLLSKSQLLTFPSVREFGGGVVLEAMALGVVPVIADYAGPGELVTPGTGIKVPMGSRDEVIAGFRAALSRLIAAPETIPALASAALARVEEHFTWDRKARQIGAVYEWVLDPKGPIPQPVPLAGA